MNTIKKSIIFVIILFYLSSCAFYPKVADRQNTQCHLVTKKLTLEVFPPIPESSLDLTGFDISDDSGIIFYILAGVVVIATVSAIVSGSIVLTGNTIHWIEQEGKCDDGAIKKAIENLLNSLNSIESLFVNLTKDIIDWVNLNMDKIHVECSGVTNCMMKFR
ncbi:hypothetical protein QUF74_04190 [Candidatus Halobeggiatoa sp. HSG11]|nr:hypothetical protein [Candidatus Halobeggiatoa sp. HSG11]